MRNGGKRGNGGDETVVVTNIHRKDSSTPGTVSMGTRLAHHHRWSLGKQVRYPTLRLQSKEPLSE